MKTRAVNQQGINKNGDCGQCCLAGITGRSVREIYDVQGAIDGLSYFTMLQLIKKIGLTYDDKLPHLDDWRNENEWQSFGRPGYLMAYEWLENAYTKISNGFIGLCIINIKGKAFEEECFDHWVIINDVKFKNEGIYKEDNVFVSCPTKGDYSINVKTFLKYYGGYNTIWIKKIKN